MPLRAVGKLAAFFDGCAPASWPHSGTDKVPESRRCAKYVGSILTYRCHFAPELY